MRGLLALSMLFSAVAFACQGGEDKPTDSLKHATQNAKYVFFGRIIGTRLVDKDRKTIVTLKPYVNWKGADDDRLVFEFQTGRSCDVGRFAEKGSEWLIVADEDRQVPTQSHSHRLWNLVEQQNTRTSVTDAVGHSAK